jgi:hypothetical protein
MFGIAGARVEHSAQSGYEYLLEAVLTCSMNMGLKLALCMLHQTFMGNQVIERFSQIQKAIQRHGQEV